MPDLRTRESIRKPIKKPQKCGFLSWQPQIDNIRTAITLHYAEIQENLNALEGFLNNIRHI